MSFEEVVPDEKRNPTVAVSIKGDSGGVYQVLIDGVDVSMFILREGFAVDFGGRIGDNIFADPSLTIRLPIHELSIDLPEAILKATAVDDEVA